MSRVAINPTFQGAQSDPGWNGEGPGSLVTWKQRRRSGISELLPGTVTVEKKDMQVSAGHKALPTMLERLAMPLRHESVLDSPDSWKECFLQAEHNAPKMRFHSKRVKIVPWTPAFTGFEQCAIIECFYAVIYIAAVLADYSQALQLITVRVASHCSTIDHADAAMWPFTLLALLIRRGVGVMCFGKLWDGHTLGVGGSSAMRQDTMGTWKTRGRDSGWWHELQKGFCYVRRDLDFSGVMLFWTHNTGC